MIQSISLFKRKAQALQPEQFDALARLLSIDGKTHRSDEALCIRDTQRTLAYAQPCCKFASLLFFSDQSVAWGEASERVIEARHAHEWASSMLKKFELQPKTTDDGKTQLEFSLESKETEGFVFDGKERRPVKIKTDVSSHIKLNNVPVVGPRGKVRLMFKQEERPVMMHVGLWNSLSVYEERELVREHDAVHYVHDRLAQRGECHTRNYDIRNVQLVYMADEFRGGPDLLAPEYLIEIEMRDPRHKDQQHASQGPRQVLRVPAFR